jgi:hypothetical protein
MVPVISYHGSSRRIIFVFGAGLLLLILLIGIAGLVYQPSDTKGILG